MTAAAAKKQLPLAVDVDETPLHDAHVQEHRQHVARLAAAPPPADVARTVSAAAAATAAAEKMRSSLRECASPAEAAAALGIEVPTGTTADGEWRNYTSGTDTSCSYKINPDGSGVLRRFSLGDVRESMVAWSPPPGAAAPTVDKAAAPAPAPTKDKAAANRIANQKFLATCAPADPAHPYLVRKQLTPAAGWLQAPPSPFGGVGALVVPFHRAFGDGGVAYQRVPATPGGTKLSSKGIGGTWTPLGPLPKDGDVVVFVGSAGTGQTIATLCNLPVFATAGDGNLPRGAQAALAALARSGIRVRPLVIGDDDWHGKPTRVGLNNGIAIAKIAAKLVGGAVGVPVFPKGVKREAGDKDFNDVARLYGANEVTQQITDLTTLAQLVALPADVADVDVDIDDGAVGDDNEGDGTAPYPSITAARASLVARYASVASVNGFWDRQMRMLLPATALVRRQYARMPFESNDKGQYKRLSAAALLQEQPEAAFDTVAYEPGRKSIYNNEGVRTLNVYIPPSVQPDNRISAALFEDHIHYLCDHEDAAARVLLDWLAHVVQRPGKKITWSPILINRHEGTGRNWLYSALRDVVGRRNALLVDTKRLQSQFTGALSTSVLVFVPEAFVPSGEKDKVCAWDVAKVRISDETVQLEMKGKDAIEIRNFANILLASNRYNALPLGPEDRRGWVHMSDAAPRDAAYYTRLYDWLAEPGTAAGISGLLWDRDLSAFLPGGRPPWSAGKQVLIEAARDPAEVAIREGIAQREGPFLADLTSGSAVRDWLVGQRIFATPNRVADVLAAAGAVRVNGGNPVRLSDGRCPKLWAVRERPDGERRQAFENLLGSALPGRVLGERYLDMPECVLALLFRAMTGVV